MIKLYDAAEEVFWALQLTLLWMVLTLAGGIVLGLGPATLAAYTVARERSFEHAWATWRREFVRGSALVLPLAGAAAVLVMNYQAETLPRPVTVAALAALAAIGAYALPMAVHYDVRLRDIAPKASLFALTRPHATVLLLFLGIAIGYATTLFPVLAIVAVGGWIQLDTRLCLRLFAENEARLARGFS